MFLKLLGAQAGLLAAGAAPLDEVLAASEAPAVGRRAPEIVVIGAGAFGGWTALFLRQMGASVTLVDAYGPGNSRSTSGEETRGIRTGYGNKELWTRWAKEAVVRWKAWDEEWGKVWKHRLYTNTGDLILREDWEPFLTETRQTWEKVGVRHEVLTHDEIRYRYPQINSEGIGVALYEPDAGVGRARMACLAVAEAFRRQGGEIVVARAALGKRQKGRLEEIVLTPGKMLGAKTFVFALGPWFPQLFPELLGDRLRTPLGHVYYYATPPGDNRFTHPNLPSYNFPGVTGWPALDHDNRGFRVRTGGRPPSDPDISDRWVDSTFFEQPRKLLAERFPALRDVPLLETRACHYELSSSRNFIVDQHPELSNVWIAGGGSAEGFKFGPVIGQYIAERVMGVDRNPELAAEFKLPTEAFDRVSLHQSVDPGAFLFSYGPPVSVSSA